MPGGAEQERLLKQLKELEAEGEKNYDDLYGARSDHDATVCYSGAKEAFYNAISLAHRLGLDEEANRLTRRLDHIKAVFRSQFSDW
jgi:ABC-type xylose transport system substrate-binding protein